MVHDFTDGHTRIFDKYQVSGEDNDKHGSHLSDETFPSIEIERGLSYLHLIVGKFCLKFPLFLAFNGFPVERFDDIDAFDDIHYSVAFLFTEVAHVPSPSLQSVCLSDGYPDIDRYNEQSGKTYIEIGCKHQDEGQDGTHEQRQQVDKEVLYGRRKTAYPLVYASLELAGFVDEKRQNKIKAYKSFEGIYYVFQVLLLNNKPTASLRSLALRETPC